MKVSMPGLIYGPGVLNKLQSFAHAVLWQHGLYFFILPACGVMTIEAAVSTTGVAQITIDRNFVV